MKSRRSVENLPGFYTQIYQTYAGIFKNTIFWASDFGRKIPYKMISSMSICIAGGGNMDNIIRTHWKSEVKRENKSILPEKAPQK